MTIAAILHHKGSQVTTISPTAKIAEVAAILADRRIGAVLVCDAANQLLGIVSERDIVRSLARAGADCLNMSAAQLMTSVLHTVTPSTRVGEAMALMTQNRVRHLPVLAQGKLAGMVSIGDIVKALLDQQAQEVDSLKAYVAGSV